MTLPIGCWWRGRRVAMIVIAVGIIAPPVKPWPTRPMIIIGNVSEKPHSIEKPTKQVAAISSSVRRPSNRSSQPESGMMMISATR